VTAGDGDRVRPPVRLTGYPLVEELWHFDISSAR
jgi:hypothetical protein